jgi:hypothetical protein
MILFRSEDLFPIFVWFFNFILCQLKSPLCISISYSEILLFLRWQITHYYKQGSAKRIESSVEEYIIIK